MTKAAEEGKVWEWRAFGKLSKTLIKRIEAYPVRLDPGGQPLINLIGQDLYLISPASEHNIKLRKSIGSNWLLKFKLLLAIEPDAIELYHESNKKIFRFPINLKVCKETAKLLNVRLPKSNLENFDSENFIQLFAQSTPQISLPLVGKVRSQFQTKNGWIELADLAFPKHRTQSISLHAFKRSAIEKMLDDLQPIVGLDVMNYLEACRKWA